ncbi:restriction endonuclease subunit S, partial [Schaalia hyovaginalis]|uniref:restriction endonuclease subunit S n=1 Tax=Schaalia hyovaginalis TaxID=29316 RepID=UPI0026E96353
AKFQEGASYPSISRRDVLKYLIPVPPIEIQREIVDILDSFTKLEAELEAELEARKAQYSFLRNMLLNFEFSAKNVSVNLLGEERFDVQEKRLGDIALIKTGRKLEGAFSGGLLPYVNGGVEPSGWVSCANNPGMVITIPSRGSVGIVGFQWDQFWLGPLCYAVAPKEGIDPRFLYHQLKRQQARLVALQQTGSIPALNKKELVGFVIDVPPLEVQRRIADVLDDFDELVNDLSSGLPAEIAARRQQYEYYRDRLLTFPEKK